MPYRSHETPEPPLDFWRALFHRWFIEYNPLYLLSAALVLGGSWVCARELAWQGSVAGPIAVAAIAEVYAVALVLGAALLVRLGLRRPATMLGLVAVVYQWDLTLHTETCEVLGSAAVPLAAAWSLVFVGKLRGLAWALRLGPSRSLLAAAAIAGAGLAAWPFVRHAGPTNLTLLLAGWVFVVVWCARRGALASVVPLDAWGETVLRWSTLAIHLVSASLLCVHVWFWQSSASFSGATLACAVLLVMLSTAERERQVWGTVLVALLVAVLFDPRHAHVTFGLAALALALRLRERPAKRVVLAAMSLVLMAAWTRGWDGGPWPAHLLALDLAWTCAVLGAGVRMRTPAALVPVGALWTHAAVVAGFVPRTPLERGATALAVGFLLLGGSLAMTWRLRRAS